LVTKKKKKLEPVIEETPPQEPAVEEPVIEEPKLEIEEGVKVDYGDATPPPVVVEEPVVAETPEDIVRVKVLFGTVGYGDGNWYEKGDVFETTRRQAGELDQKFIQIL
jgi:hypothetical protein